MVGFNKPLKKQSLSKFKQNAEQEIKRLKHSGEPETITVDGKPQVVVLSSSAYRRLATDAQFAREIRSLRKSVAQAKRGEGIDYRVVHKQLEQEFGNGRK